ncbi:MAG: DEAD/DEAH box helicase family protein [Gammaproteobacteria bacterium]|nr:DEAD/DEAH box helicase family protein [Gammaproteobacteria bacterium]
MSEELKAIESRIEELDRERSDLIQRKQQLLAQSLSPYKPQQLTSDQKVALFQALFKGRTDVYATRWQNSIGRSGYSVACHNEWVPGVCNKPRIKCGECSHRQYRELDAQAVYDHLTGKHIVGLYPLMSDEACHLLAADFDKSGWQEAVKAMAQVCFQHTIPHAIEISRSGNGAHLWIFFKDRVSAREARQLGFALLDKAMDIHPGISFESYDRLFPNQDIMPEGGFGNLIALPLQHQARQLGNSQFVDTSLTPYPDQWAFLSDLQRLSAFDVKRLLKLLAPQQFEAPENSLPWEQGIERKNEKIADCPKKLAVTLANHIYIKLDELPAALTAKLRRLASFSNPVFFKTQALRFSTHGIPRYITCARIEQGYLSIPRGCIDEVMALFEDQGIAVVLYDKRVEGTPLNGLEFLGELRKDQQQAVEAITANNVGILHAPTAFGKTVTAIGVITRRKVNTLILTHSRQLLDQWKERIRSFTSGVEVGTVGGGKKKPTGQIDVATYQSLIDKKSNTVSPLLQEYGQIIIDECHHISAPRYEMLLNESRAKFVLGLTATPNRQDGHQKIMFMIAGPVRHKVEVSGTRGFEQKVVVQQLYDKPPHSLIQSDVRPHIAEIYRWLVENNSRNRLIVDNVIESVKSGAHSLVLTERREHAEILAGMLEKKDISTLVLRGAMRVKERKAANEKLSDAQVIVATGKYIGEGFDLPRLDTLFLALPIAWKGSLAQYAGRLHRESEGKDQVTIYDYVDEALPMLQRMFGKREKGYKAMGYELAPIKTPGARIKTARNGDRTPSRNPIAMIPLIHPELPG